MKRSYRLLSFLLAMALLVGCLPQIPLVAEAATEQTQGSYTYTVENGEATITYCDTELSGAVTIPGTLGGYPVTAIAADAFRYCGNITDITIPGSVKEIGESSFCNMDRLESISFVSGAVTIGDWAFMHNYALKTIDFGTCSATIGDWAFMYNYALKTIDFGTGATTIGEMAFSYSDALTTIDFGTGFVYIDNSAFFLCPELTTVSFPDCGAYVGKNVFSESTKLAYTSYDNCDYLGNSNNPYIVLMKSNDYERTSISIHHNTKTIAGGACYAPSLTTFVLPGGLVAIGEDAFSGCYNVPYATVGWQVKYIGKGAFEGQVKFNVADANTTYCSDDYGALYTEGKTALLQVPEDLTGTYTIPATVTKIEDAIFRRCENLTAFAVENGNTAYCADRQGILYNKDMTYLFCVPAGISGNVTIPDSVTDHAPTPFYNCQNLTSVTFGSGITALNRQLFFRCDQLKYLYLHENITALSSEALRDCYRLEYNTYGNGMYLGSASSPYLVLVKAASTDITSFRFHPSTGIIYDSAFRDCTLLTSITLPDGLHTIGNGIFTGCTSLEEITIPAGLTIGDSIFYGCTGLKTAHLPQDVDRAVVSSLSNLTLTDIYFDGTKAQWEALTTEGPSYSVFKTAVIHTNEGDIAPGVVNSGKWSENATWTRSFDDVLTITGTGSLPQADTYLNTLRDIKKIVISEGITAVEAWAFSVCSNISAVSFPASVKSIHPQLAEHFFSLEDVYYNGTRAQWNALWATQTSPFQDCTIHLLDDTLTPGAGYSGVIGSNLQWTLSNDGVLTISGEGEMEDVGDLESLWKAATKIVIEEGVTSVAKDAFDQCPLVTEISLPSTLTAIGGGAFMGTAITEIRIPEGVTELTMGTFCNCDNLKTVYLPVSVERIDDAFLGCEALEAVYYAGARADWGVINFGHNAPFQNATVYLSDGVLYPGTVMAGVIGNNLFWTLDADGTLTISGTGAWNGVGGAGPDWGNVKKIVVEEGVTTIGNGAFMGCSSATEVQLPSTVTAIGDHAFDFCQSLTSITLPANLKTIGPNAFSGCGLTGITIPEKVTSIGFCAFAYCENLVSVTILGAPRLEDSVFWGCTKLTTVNLGKTTYIGGDSFHDCTALTAITIPTTVETIGRAAFMGCTSLEKLTIQDGVTWIDYCAFEDCTSLKSIVIPNSVTYVAERAFQGCSSLESLTVPFIGPDRESSNRWSYPLGWFFGIEEFEGSMAVMQKTIEFEGIFDQLYYIPASLRSVTVTGNVLPYAALRNCSNITTVYLSNQLSKIPAYTFDGCTNLTDVYFQGTQAQWNALSKGANNAPLYNATIHFNYQMIPSGWYQRFGCWYFGRNGKNVTGWLRDGGYWYYMNQYGVMQTGWLQEGSVWYYLKPDGQMVTGEYTIDGARHKFNSSGVWQGQVVQAKNGWKQESGKWYYYKNNVKQKGWLKDGSSWYYLDSNGVMQTGWVYTGGVWYYMKSGGQMVTGEYTIDGARHKFNSSGVWLGQVQTQKNGWVKESGYWYYYLNGKAATGWRQIGGVWYYFNTSGVMLTGWLKDGNTWYYLQSSGAMKTGWLQDGGHTYYLLSSGAMATGTHVIDGVTYTFKSSGALVG